MMSTVGQYGWNGGLGTVWNSYPREEMVTTLLTQVMLTSPTPPTVFLDFSSLAYTSIDD